MITFYARDETNFEHNGLGVLDNYIVNPVVAEELNGLFSLEFDYPINAPHADELIFERIVRCPVPSMDDQLFRIALQGKETRGFFHIVAYHVFYDLASNLIEDTYIVEKTGSQAIYQLLNAAQFSHPFTSGSNIINAASSRLVRVNPVEALINTDRDNSFLSRWGGEIYRDNFYISMREVRGSDNGVCIRDKKNLTGYRSDVDFNTVVTRIMPQGFNGLFLPEKYVDSPRIGNYNSPRIKILKYETVKAVEEGKPADSEVLPLPEAYTALRVLSEKEYSDNHIDIPQATYNVEFAPLERTEEYKGFAVLETINIGDTVTVIHEEENLNISARMVSYTYNPLTKSYISVTLGNYAPKFTNIAKDINRLENDVEQAKTEAAVALTSADGKNTNFYGSIEPTNPRKGDIWYRDNGEKIEMWIYEMRDDVTQWFPLMTDLTQEEMRLVLEEAQALVDEAREAAENAMAAGEAAQAAVLQAQTEMVEAVEKANQAYDTALDALNGIETASQQAAYAYNKSVKSTTVDYAVSISGITAPSSGWQSTIPIVTAGQFLWSQTVITLQDDTTITSYSVSKQPADGENGADAPTITAVREQYYLSTSATAQIGGGWSDTVPIWSNGRYYWTRVVATYSNGATTYSTPVLANGLNNSLLTALEAKTAVQTLETTVTQHATAISLNASNITTLSGQISTAETSLTVQAGQIALKASQSSVDTLTGRVTSTESNILQQAEMINLRVSKDDIINQINLSTEGVLISGSKVHITGQTTIDNGIIKTAMISDAAITNAKIANLDAAKINTGTLAAERIAAGSITSAKLTIAAGFITNAMIADATIQSAKIAALDAGKITTGILSADRIGANSISSSKLSVANGFISNAMIANGAITDAKIADATITKAKIAEMAVDTAQIQTAAITTVLIADAVITNAKIIDATINNAKINSLDAGKITSGSLNSDRLAANSISSTKLSIANGFISTAMLADGSVTNAKLASSGLDASKITTGTLDFSKVTASNLNISSLSSTTSISITATISVAIKATQSSSHISLESQDISLRCGTSGAVDIGPPTQGSYIRYVVSGREFRPTGSGFNLGTSAYPWTNAHIGTLNVSTLNVTNIDASKLTSGTMPIARIADGAVTNAKLASGIDAAKITTGTLALARISVNGNFIPTASSYTLGSATYYWSTGYITNLYAATSVRLGTATNSTVGFFGTTPTTRKSVSAVSTSGTLANAITGINNLLTALKSYGLIS